MQTGGQPFSLPESQLTYNTDNTQKRLQMALNVLPSVKTPAYSLCFQHRHGESWLVNSDYQLAVLTTLNCGQCVTLSKSLTSVSLYPPLHTLCCHEATPFTVFVLCGPLLHFFS